MKTKKLIVLLILVVTSMLVLAGCKTTAPSASQPETTAKKDKYVIGFLTNHVNDYGAYIVAGGEAAAKELGIEIKIENSNFDANLQVQQAENLIALGVDALVMKSQDKDACGPISQACADAGIPLITMGQVISSHQDVNVGSDDIYAGELLGQALADAMGHKGNVVILMGDPREAVTPLRRQGFQNILNKYPDIKVIAEENGKWMRADSLTITENWIQAGLKLDSVWAINDEMGIGAYMACQQEGFKTITGGIDALPATLEMVKSGDLVATVLQDGFAVSNAAVKTAVKMLQGEKFPEHIDIPFKLITADKADETLAYYASMK